MSQSYIDEPSESVPPDRVANLIAYDEQLRQGSAAVSTREGDEQPSGAPADLVQCLHLIEQVWPRAERGSSPRAPSAADLPTHIGRFEIERVLGSGGFGIVYLARDPLLSRLVALKVPRLHALASPGLRERFRREARATAALDHPHIVPIHETGEEGPLCYIAFAYCEGPSLAQWLKLQAADVPPRVAATIVRQLAEAMHYSHSHGILHRDLKPSNVLLFPSPDPATGNSGGLHFVPRIVDFGLARLMEDDLEATSTSAVIGTPLYMAPEQALGKQDEIGPAADLYALGVILYELLCRQPPFVGNAPLEVLDQVRSADPPAIRKQPDVPRDLETICLRCLQKRPEERYATAQALADDLGRFLDGKEVAARPVSPLQRLVRWCQQPQRLREAGLTVMAVNIAMGGWTFLSTMMITLGFVPSPGGMTTSEVLRHAVPIILFVSPPLVAAGWYITRGQRWAVQLSLCTGVGMTLFAALLTAGLPNPFSGLWNDLPGFQMLMYSMMTMLCLLQTIASAIAWVALQFSGPPRRLHPPPVRSLR